MEHGNRIKLVRGIHIRVLKKYKDSVLFGGVYGSTASGRDTEYSDIEMMYIVHSETPSSKLSFLYRGTPIELDLVPLAEVQSWLHNVQLSLPLKMGNLQGLQLLSGENRRRADVLAQYAGLPQAHINDFFLKYGSQIAYESYNKIRSLVRRAERQNLHLYTFELMQEISLALALINRQPLRKGYFAGIMESMELALLPIDFKQTITAFMKVQSYTEAIEIGRKLISAYEEFLTQMEIPVRNLQTLDEIEW